MVYWLRQWFSRGCLALGLVGLWALGIGLLSGPVWAEPDRTLSGLYEHLRASTKNELAAEIRRAERIADEQGGPLPPTGRAALIDLVKMRVYQRMVNGLLCAAPYLPGGGDEPDALQSCQEQKNTQQQIMLRISDEYSSRTVRGSAFEKALQGCYRKARLFSYEVRFPPYDFLTMSDGAKPNAYDPGVFVRCFREIP
jgi:hypothetical protein